MNKDKLNEAVYKFLGYKSAYLGAREDLLIWKRRALEAEELNRKFMADSLAMADFISYINQTGLLTGD